jgi:uncharacterized protein YdeI (YjbR/CyaY-like superfamily)
MDQVLIDLIIISVVVIFAWICYILLLFYSDVITEKIRALFTKKFTPNITENNIENV